MSFVELNRTFFRWSEDHAPGDWSLLQRFSGGQDWSELLKLQRVIVLAEAGSGKSDELKAQAKIQRAAGRFAFYVPVQDVARAGLPAALSSRDRAVFASWKDSSDQAWFFVDSVDELKLNVLAYTVQVAIAPGFPRVRRSGAATLFLRTIVGAAGGM